MPARVTVLRTTQLQTQPVRAWAVDAPHRRLLLGDHTLSNVLFCSCAALAQRADEG